MKFKEVTKKTHTYVLPEYDNVVVRAISETHLEEYNKEKKTIYRAAATKTVEGNKVETVNYYVAIDDFVKRSTARQSLTSKLSAISESGVDLSKMTAAELLAQLQ